MPTLQQAIEASPIVTAYYDAGDLRVIVARHTVPPQVGDQRVPPRVAELTHYEVRLQRGPAFPQQRERATSLDEALSFLKTLALPDFDVAGSDWRPATAQTGFDDTIWTDNSAERDIPPLNPLDDDAPTQRP